jgi:hypothetical protein
MNGPRVSAAQRAAMVQSRRGVQQRNDLHHNPKRPHRPLFLRPVHLVCIFLLVVFLSVYRVRAGAANECNEGGGESSTPI